MTVKAPLGLYSGTAEELHTGDTSALKAAWSSFDDSLTGLGATNVQDAITALYALIAAPALGTPGFPAEPTRTALSAS